ncbi:MAG: transcription-repair coupling factor [Clostridiales bacterium]|nr:transcription-repair coupling factor [Clostridiales bacterium]
MKQALFSTTAPAWQRLTEATVEQKTVALTGLPDTMAAFVAAKLADETGKRVLLLSANDLKATHDADDGQQLLGSRCTLLPGGEIDLTRGASSHESAWRRLETLARVTSGEVSLLCTSLEAAIQRMGSADRFAQKTIRLHLGDTIDPQQLIRDLTGMGYERVSMVEGKGQCAQRGDIVDVYPPSGAVSLRIEFFGDEVDSIRAFDTISQRSLDHAEEAVLPPATEVLLGEDEAPAAARRMREAIEHARPDKPQATNLFADLPPLPDDAEEDAAYYDKKIAPKVKQREQNASRLAELERRIGYLMKDADAVETGLPFRRIRAWLPVLTDETYTVLDWFQPEIIVLSDPDMLRKRAEERRNGFAEDLDGAMARGEAVQEQQTLLLSWEELLAAMNGSCTIALTEFLEGLGGVRVQDAIDLKAERVQGYSGQIKLLAEDCREWLDAGHRVALLCGGVARGQRLENSLREMELSVRFTEDGADFPKGRVTILPGSLAKGFIWPDAGLVVVSDTDVYGAGYRKVKKRTHSGEKIAAFTDLKPGDYVVHEEYGVGVFLGTTQIRVGGPGGVRRDYLQIQYLGSDKLNVPIEQLDRVQRYIGNPQNPPKLNSLGNSEWQKQKAKVREGLKAIAFDLVKLYATRSQSTGFAFSPDTPWQREFEDMFPYELTPDQAQSVMEITADMESPKNMDRLLCGDVGYGKTEVSLRAAFKALMDNKQVAILAPTTILAQQHYNTVLKRFKGFPVRVEVLSRFRTAKEVKDVLSRLKAGEIDILVGTHRLLAKDVQFRDLGLLIVDEEQRFGVQHKEQIKHMKNQVDVLTLSATPIPRTLHMSMVGIRDMSVLETPPEERLPVQTRVVEYNDGMIRDAILREISRGGQVYFLYNQVRRIDEFYARLRALVPEARIGVAHGQMKEHGLEDVMMDFYGGSYDVLLCTTIIESGLDVPTANTLIVFDADRFGLSQLYQLRGRVGRSNRQAYAYFTVRPDKNLSETADQRLAAIREFTEFGAGFRIAMRDLEIRGAGNILGAEQHGHLATVGYDMYCKLMEEVLAETKDEQLGKAPPQPHMETRVDVKVDAYLPESYVKDDRQRMEMYKRIAGLVTDADRADILDELMDRFGEVPPPVETLLDIAQLRAQANQLGISQVTYKQGGFLVLKIDLKHMPPDDEAYITAMSQADKRLMPSRMHPDVVILAAPKLNEYGILREAVKTLMQWNQRYEAIVAQKAAQQA